MDEFVRGPILGSWGESGTALAVDPDGRLLCLCPKCEAPFVLHDREPGEFLEALVHLLDTVQRCRREAEDFEASWSGKKGAAFFAQVALRHASQRWDREVAVAIGRAEAARVATRKLFESKGAKL